MLTLALSFIFQFSFSSLPAPKVNCVSVLPNGNVQITWERVNDPTSIFTAYEVFLVSGSSSTSLQVIGNINTTTYTHVTPLGNTTSLSYVVGTTCSTSITNVSDTISSIKLSVNNPSNGRAILNWNPIFSPTNSPTASNWYKIYREYPLGTWTLIDSVQYGNEYYRDTITICNDSINYRVTNSNTGCTSTSSIDGKTFNDVLPPYSPVIKSVTVDTTNNLTTINWHPTRPLDTEGYIILKRIGSSWVPIDTIYGINNTTYQYLLSNAGGESECYGIAAFDSCYYGSPLTPNTSAMGDPHCTIYLEQSYRACDKTIDLTWSAYSGWKTGVFSYYIYYTVNGSPEIFASSTSATSFSLSNVSPDSNYCFTIRAVSNDFNDTTLSNKICVITEYPYISDTNYLQAVSVESENLVQVRIFTTIKNTIQGYNILKSEDNGTSFNNIGFVSNSTTPIIFNDNAVIPENQTYQYKAIAIDSCGNTTNKETNIGETILLRATSNSADYTVNLNWNNYQIWNGAIREFNIYRKLGNGAPVLIGTVPAGIFSYQDDISSFYASSDDGRFCYFIEAIETTNSYGISETSKSNTVCITPNHIIYVPNSFSPNDDGLNDEFIPVIGFADYGTYSIQVFNRLGQEIFTSTEITEGWDGKHKSKLCPQGMYVYVILIEDAEGKPIQKSGTIFLKRN